jgi:hypothetical protein
MHIFVSIFSVRSVGLYSQPCTFNSRIGLSVSPVKEEWFLGDKEI